MLDKEEQREWLIKRSFLRVPTSRLKKLSQLLERIGYKGIYAYTSVALDLHDYQYHGPDPDTEVSKYRDRMEAATDTILLTGTLVELVEEKLKPRLEQAGQ